MDYLEIIAVIGAGVLVGFINTLAGSGSVISLPLLIFMGLDPHVANGTNRIAILMQSATGTFSFYRKGKLDVKKGLLMAGVASMGAVVGANVAVSLDEAAMRQAIGWVMVFMLLVILFKPQKWWKNEMATAAFALKWYHLIALFFMGAYGGFIQVGTGVLLLSLLVVGLGLDAVRANAIKVLIIGLFNVLALSIYIYNDQVNWYWGIILAVGNVIGTYIATSLGLRMGTRFIHALVVLMILVSASEFIFGAFSKLFAFLI